VDPSAPHVVICGAGFGGLSAISGLTRAGLRVTLVDEHLYSTFQPLLYQVATGGLNPGDVAYPAGGFADRYGANFRRGELATIDTASRRIKLGNGLDLDYDYLILATGVSASYYGIKGAAENTFGLYTRTDAIVLRDKIMAAFERLSVGSGDLDITVVGGGATGVELAGTAAELRATVIKATFPDVDPARIHVRLVEMAPSLLGPFDEKLRDYAKAQLLDRGVDVRLSTQIEEVVPGYVCLAGADDLRSDITVWAAGVAASSAVSGWGLPQGKHGRILIGPDLRVHGQDRIFAVGDIALNPDDPTPQLAQPALQMGKHAARQIVHLERKEPTETFRYHDKGTMATIGRRSAVVQLAGGLRLRGTLAWLAWFVLHLFYLLGGRNRVSTLVNLTFRYVFWGRGGAVIVGDEPDVVSVAQKLFLHSVVIAAQAGVSWPRYEEDPCICRTLGSGHAGRLRRAGGMQFWFSQYGGHARRGIKHRCGKQPQPGPRLVDGGRGRPRFPADQPVWPADVAEPVPRQGRDAGVRGLAVHHGLPADHAEHGRGQAAAGGRGDQGAAAGHRRQSRRHHGARCAGLLPGARHGQPVGLHDRVAR
jgi:NADH:ubiquinone reductase (H+-translocating)